MNSDTECGVLTMNHNLYYYYCSDLRVLRWEHVLPMIQESPLHIKNPVKMELCELISYHVVIVLIKKYIYIKFFQEWRHQDDRVPSIIWHNAVSVQLKWLYMRIDVTQHHNTETLSEWLTEYIINNNWSFFCIIIAFVCDNWLTVHNW